MVQHCLQLVKSRLTVDSIFDSNFRNRIDPTIPTLGIESKPDSIPTILESTRPDPTRFSIPILEIESNRQEIENDVICQDLLFLAFEI